MYFSANLRITTFWVKNNEVRKTQQPFRFHLPGLHSAFEFSKLGINFPLSPQVRTSSSVNIEKPLMQSSSIFSSFSKTTCPDCGGRSLSIFSISHFPIKK